MNPEEIAVKGIRQGLLINLGEGTWEERLARLTERLEAGRTFFQGGRAALDVGARTLDDGQVRQVQDLLARYGVELWALLGTCDVTILAAVRCGLVPDLALGDELDKSDEVAEERGPAPLEGLVLERTLRSGQRVEHAGDVVIIGDVHAGAEVVAGRHVVVWGKLRGVVHAGAAGDEDAMVCALDLAPTQLRIAGYIARAPEEKRRRPVPEMARVRSGHIEALPWRGR
jgi:septum site-determining protein MinC